MKQIKSLFLMGFVAVLFYSAACAQAVEKSLSEVKLEAPQSIEVSIYSNSTSLVHEIRAVSLETGNFLLRATEVPETVVAESVQLKARTNAADLSVIEQSYENNWLDSVKLLDRYVGKKIKILRLNDFQDRKDIVEATVLSNHGEPIFEIEGEIYTGYPGVKIFPQIPEGIDLKPSLLWHVSSRSRKQYDLDIFYLAYGFRWQADYVLRYDENLSELSSWVTIENQSGAALENAKIHLVAGNLNQAQAVQDYAPKAYRMEMMATAASAPSFDQAQTFEYYRYDYSNPVSLERGKSKQLELLRTSSLKVQKEYEVANMPNYFYGARGSDPEKIAVNAFLVFYNTKENGLGSALPQGTVRVYEGSGEGAMYFLGSDVMRHTPDKEKVRLQVGQSFDLSAERKQTAYEQKTSKLHESDWEVLLRNAKDKEVEVSVIENLQSQSWKILTESHPHENLDAFRIRYKVKVPAKGESKILYRVQTGY